MDFTEQETTARAEAALKRMLATPHQPHSAIKIDKRKAKGGTRANRPGNRGRTPASKDQNK